jgi:hypothetical protein
MRKVYLFFILTIVIAFTCDHFDSRLKIVNRSEYPIVANFSGDTILDIKLNEHISYYLSSRIQPGDTLRRTISGKNTYSQIIKHSTNNKLNIFIVRYDTLYKYRDWVYIYEKGLYERFCFTQSELVSNNWIVNYPPK